jgi:hypothetical protein
VKKLRIEYDGAVLFDADVDELTWTDSAGGVSVVGKFKSVKSQANVADLLGALSKSKKGAGL